MPTLLNILPAVSPPAAPAVVPPDSFPPSAELGEQIARLAEAQAEIDRRKAEELARLRAIQSRD
ncbi:MAG: hypothetical protein K2V38_00320 [Gemmataceae bacterium]|nr:hypothetical protein [Gemmataceae bacterium]